MPKFKNRDKVIIKSKSIWCKLSESNIYNKGKEKQNWYFLRYAPKKDIRDFDVTVPVCIISVEGMVTGDYFLETDIIHANSIKIFDDRDFII